MVLQDLNDPEAVAKWKIGVLERRYLNGKMSDDDYRTLAIDCAAVSKAINVAFATNDIGDYRMLAGQEQVIKDIFDREMSRR